jgi:hypothetical protein
MRLSTWPGALPSPGLPPWAAAQPGRCITAAALLVVLLGGCDRDSRGTPTGSPARPAQAPGAAAGQGASEREPRSPLPARNPARDTTIKLETVCTLERASLFHAFSGVDLALERAGRAIVAMSGPDGGFELRYLSMPDCRTEPFFGGSPKPSQTIGHANAVGDVLVDDGSYDSRAHLLKKPGREVVVIDPPADFGKGHWSPVLSDDGDVVWIASRIGDDGELETRLVVRDAASGDERSIPLERNRKQVMILGANVARNEFVLSAFPGTVYVVDGSGAVKWGPVETGVSLVTPNFRRVDEGWVAWDSFENNAVVRWSTTAGKGERKFPLVHFDAVSVSPSQTRIAVAASLGSRLSDKDVVAILSLPDGKEIFYQTLPMYTRARLAFLDDEHLAVSSGGKVDVLRVPGSMPKREGTIAKPIDVEERKVSHIRQLGEKLGLQPEKTTPQTAAALVGTWKLSDVQPGQGCGMDMPFVEIRADGKTYHPETGTPDGEISIKESYVEIKDKHTGGALMIFPMSGGFYVPSFECMLLELERTE